MHPYIGKALAEAHQDELLRQAERHRLVRTARAGRPSWWLKVLRRLSGRLDHPEVAVGVGERREVGPGFPGRLSDELGPGGHRPGG
jgi:hypothetical protein